MSTSILNAPTYDPKRDKRRRIIIVLAVLAVLVVGYVAFSLTVFGYLKYPFQNWSEERVVNRFFQALEVRDYEKAYGIWMADPNWKQHPNAHPRYTFGQFYLDWGPGGEYGLIKSHKIDGTKRTGSGVVVVTTVNERSEQAHLWVEKSDKTMTYSPF